jgi:BioD-like phosphotransacetylase family protein
VTPFMIMAALESDTSCIVLTNNIVPDSNIIARASEADIPLLLVTEDTYQSAKQIETIEAAVTTYDTEKAALLERLVRDCIDVGKF